MVLIGTAGGLGYFFWPPGFWSGSGERAASESSRGSKRPVPVGVAIVKHQDVNVYLEGLGTVTPFHTVTVRSRVDGLIMRMLFQEGQPVKAGELLAEIDPRPFQIQLAQAEAQRARDQALLDNTRITLKRYHKLLAEHSIAKQDWDTQESLVSQHEAAIRVDQAQIDNAKLQLQYARVTAPIDGRLGLRQVDPGNIVRANDLTGLVVITQLQPMGVVFAIPQDRLPAVLTKRQTGEPLRVDAYDREGKRKLASGELLAIDNQIDPATGTVKLKAVFPNTDESLFANQFVNVRLRLEVRLAVTVVPSAAVQRGTPGTFVYVIQDDDTATVRSVQLGPVEEGQVVVETGLTPGERVVVEGADKLREGAKVERAGSLVPAGSEDRPGQGHRRGKGK